jgi:hypothetical protein
LKYQRDFYEDLFTQPSHFGLVCTEEDQIVGSITARTEPEERGFVEMLAGKKPKMKGCTYM